MIPRRTEVAIVDMILVDWTRMGSAYCLAGVVPEGGKYRVVRPLLGRAQATAVRKVGWSAFLLARHARWEIFELVGPRPALPDAPHVEDLWVRSLQPRRRSAPLEARRAILAVTMPPAGEPLFGAPLTATWSAAFLEPGTGGRSLTTLVVSPDQITFGACRRSGTAQPDFRVTLPIPDLGPRTLPCKDHHLLARVEQHGGTLDQQLAELRNVVGSMGSQVAVRLGLSRPFQQEDSREPPRCWLMADGFFSLENPQP
jgi:hypothetical protein